MFTTRDFRANSSHACIPTSLKVRWQSSFIFSAPLTSILTHTSPFNIQGHGLRRLRRSSSLYFQAGLFPPPSNAQTLSSPFRSQTSSDAWFKPTEENIHSGVCLRVDQGRFRVFPYENPYLQPFERAIRILNPIAAVKVRSAAIHAALAHACVPISEFHLNLTEIPLDLARKVPSLLL